MNPLTASIASGLVFGTALTLSGVASPTVITDQFTFRDMHMLLAFTTASATSAIIFTVYNAMNKVKISVRKNTTYGWFSRYDGNIVGGAMVGLGMALSGACPGTVIVQAAGGSRSSGLLMFSGLLSGLAFLKWKARTETPVNPAASSTVMQATGWSNTTAVTLYDLILLSFIAMTSIYGAQSLWFIHPAAGGLLIGLSQAVSLLLVQKPVGVSTAYEDAAKLFLSFVDETKRPSMDSLGFAGGLFIGARLTMSAVPVTLEALAANQDHSILSVLAGGFFLVFGARIAGGCTSGHGISGMAAMGLSSFVTVASMFGTAIVATQLYTVLSY